MKSKGFNATFSLSLNETVATGNKAENYYFITGQLFWTHIPALWSPGQWQSSVLWMWSVRFKEGSTWKVSRDGLSFQLDQSLFRLITLLVLVSGEEGGQGISTWKFTLVAKASWYTKVSFQMFFSLSPLYVFMYAFVMLFSLLFPLSSLSCTSRSVRCTSVHL